MRKWLCAPPRQVADIAARQEIVGAFIESDELHQSLSKTLRKLPDLERLIARVHAFSLQHAQNQATHYRDVGRARLGELIKTLEGFEALEKAARRVAADAAGVLTSRRISVSSPPARASPTSLICAAHFAAPLIGDRRRRRVAIYRAQR